MLDHLGLGRCFLPGAHYPNTLEPILSEYTRKPVINKDYLRLLWLYRPYNTTLIQNVKYYYINTLWMCCAT